ncbi:MAG: hypothetical protein AB7I57_23990 [Pirellulales bacterium]
MVHRLRLAWLALPLVAGCSFGPQRVHAPNIDASDAAGKALQAYDKNGDGALDATELVSAPGLLAALKVYDTNQDQKISEDELVARIESWSASGPAMMTVECVVTLDGRLLKDATVTYVPEPYLEGALHEGMGTTGQNGMATISIAPEHLPEGLKRIRAMNAGTYKVQITHPSVRIPEKYNTQTTLGSEVSKQTTPSTYEEFKLSTK